MLISFYFDVTYNYVWNWYFCLYYFILLPAKIFMLNYFNPKMKDILIYLHNETKETVDHYSGGDWVLWVLITVTSGVLFSSKGGNGLLLFLRKERKEWPHHSLINPQKTLGRHCSDRVVQQSPLVYSSILRVGEDRHHYSGLENP